MKSSFQFSGKQGEEVETTGRPLGESRDSGFHPVRRKGRFWKLFSAIFVVLVLVLVFSPVLLHT